LTRDSSAIKVAAFLESSSKNDCQALVRKLYPEVDKALNWLENHQLPAKMTGTGACVFSQFSTANEAHTALHSLPKDLLGFVAQGINNSPLLNLVPKS
jgi:4-diphosphocytidyl-2-C-methyl-D-erythritol kinase